MADFRIKLGVDVETKDIGNKINSYKAKPIEVKTKLDTSGIDKKLASYKVKKSIEINTKLNTKGLAKKIGEYKPKTPIELTAKLDAKSVDTAIKNIQVKPIKIDVKLNTKNINQQLKGFTTTSPIKVDAKLDTKSINKQIRGYNCPAIKINAKINKKDVDTVLKNYKAKPIKLDAEIRKTQLNKQISDFTPRSTIKLKAALQKGAIAEEIRKFKPTTPIKVDLEPDYTDINEKVNQIVAKGGIPIQARLIPASKGFDNGITKKSVEINATLEPSNINNTIDNFKPSSKIKVDAKLVPKDINEQIKNITKPTEPINIDVKLDESNVNSAIALFQPTATLGVKPDLILEDVDDQIRAYVPKAQVKVNVKLDDEGIDGKTGKQNLQAPIQVDVKLNRENINEQIKNFTTKTKVKVGVKLDFASHKDDSGKEIQKGISQQLKEFETKSKIKVGVELDRDSIAQEVNNISVDTPIRLGVELNPDGVQNVQNQVDNLRRQIEALGNIDINIGGNGAGNNGGGTGNGNGNGRGTGGSRGGRRRNADAENARETAQAYSELLRVISELGTKRARLNSPSVLRDSANEINELESQIEELEARYDEIMDSFEDRFTRRQQNRIAEAEEKANRGESLSESRSVDREAIDERTSAYTRLMRVLRELGSLRKQLSGLDTLENPDLANTLTDQIQTLEQQYDNMMDSIRARQIQFTDDQQSQMRTQIDSTNRKIEANQSKAEDNFVSENRERAYDRLLSTLEQIHSLEQNIAKLRDQGGNTNQIAELENQLNNLVTTYQNLIETMHTNLTPEQWGSLDSEIDNAEHEMSLLQAKFEDTRNKLAEGIGEKLYRLDFDAEAKKINSDFGRLSTQSNAARDSVDGLNQALADMKTAYNEGNVEALIEANERYAQYAKTAKNQIAMQQRDEKDFADTYKDDVAELEAVADKIDRIKTRIAKLDVKSNSNELDFLTRDLQELEAAYQRLYTKLQGKIPTDQLSALGESAIETAQKLELIERQLKDAKENLAAKINIKLNDGTFDNNVSNITSKFEKLRNKSDEIRTAMNEVNAALSRMKSASGSGNVDKLIEANQQYERALKAVKNQLDINARAEKDNAAAQKLADKRNEFMSSIDAWLTKNSAAVDRFGAAMLDLKAKAESCDSVTLDHLKTQFKQLDAEADAAGLKMQSFGDRIKAQFKKYSAYFGVAELFMYAEQGLRDMFQQVVAIDTAMTELKKVTNETDASYDNFLSNAANRAKEIGTTIDGLVTSTADFARLGYSFEESQGLAEVANIYTVVGDEIEGVEDATQSLVSTLAAFKHEMGDMSDSDFAMSIVDKMNEVSNNYAISSGGIGEALQRSASSMAAANNTLDETIAMITAANEVAQNPEKVGNAMKTISMRMKNHCPQ